MRNLLRSPKGQFQSKRPYVAFALLLATIAFLIFAKLFQPQVLNYPCDPQGCVSVVKAVEPTKNVLYQGKVSYYSKDGCIGCSPTQKMGNGQPFNENAMTLAIPCEDVKTKKNPNGIKYGTRVKVWNMDNGWVKSAVISDCGGFSKYNRVADLSKGLMNALEAKTDKSIIQIYTEAK